MLMKSVSFGNEVDSKVWDLFKDANEIGSRLDYTLEIIDAALTGNIDFNREFELEKYINSIRRTRRLEALREAKKTVHITEDSYDDEETSGVSSDRVSYFVDGTDEYAILEDSFELQYAIDKFNSLQDYFMVNARCDVKYAVRQALKGIPDSIELLKNLCSDYPVAGELLRIILGSGYKYEEIFPEVWE